MVAQRVVATAVFLVTQTMSTVTAACVLHNTYILICIR